MMKMRLALFGLVATWLAQSPLLALDLTPQNSFLQPGEGGPIPIVRFDDGGRKINFQPPPNWQPSGGGNSVSFFSPDVKQAYMKLVAVKMATPPPPGEDLQSWVLQFIPPNSEKVEFVQSYPSPFTVQRQPSTEFIYKFSLFSVRVSIAIAVVDLSPKQRLVMIVSSDAKNFDRVHQQALSSMFTWSPEK